MRPEWSALAMVSELVQSAKKFEASSTRDMLAQVSRVPDRLLSVPVGTWNNDFFPPVGELTAHAVGPHKVAYCELYDHGDGTFTLNVKPQESGRHALTIKYGGWYQHQFELPHTADRRLLDVY